MLKANPVRTRSLLSISFLLLLLSSCNFPSLQKAEAEAEPTPGSFAKQTVAVAKVERASLNAEEYDRLMLKLANHDSSGLWPSKAVRPLPGAMLPYNRIIAYYGNLFSKRMGVLGELPPDEMLQKLKQETKKWQEADTLLKAQPALHYIAVTAQGKPGPNKKYRQRMPFQQIDKVLELAKKIDAIVFLDVQVGHSTLAEEIPLLKQYLAMPNVHLGIDPEFAMQHGVRPGDKVGSFDASDVNYAAQYLKGIVSEYKLPPKMLIVHRFTQNMVTHAQNIQTIPEVQIVMAMDGFGFPAKKIDTYKRYIAREPVQFTGFKLFYKNDILDRKYGRLMTPQDVLKLRPQPIYIQYQ